MPVAEWLVCPFCLLTCPSFHTNGSFLGREESTGEGDGEVSTFPVSPSPTGSRASWCARWLVGRTYLPHLSEFAFLVFMVFASWKAVATSGKPAALLHAGRRAAASCRWAAGELEMVRCRLTVRLVLWSDHACGYRLCSPWRVGRAPNWPELARRQTDRKLTRSGRAASRLLEARLARNVPLWRCFPPADNGAEAKRSGDAVVDAGASAVLAAPDTSMVLGWPA